MVLFLEDEYLQDDELMNDLQNELDNAEKICKSYGYDAEFFISPKHKNVRGKIVEKNKYAPTIYIETDGRLEVEIQTTSYGSLTIDEYDKFLNDCENARECAEELKRNFVICSELAKE